MLFGYLHVYSEFSKSTVSWQLVSVAGNDQLGTNERIQEKIDKIKRFAREAQVYCDGAELMRVGEFQVPI